jgi:hypothetical protein
MSFHRTTASTIALIAFMTGRDSICGSLDLALWGMKYITAILVPTDAQSEQKHEAYIAAAARDLGRFVSYEMAGAAIGRGCLYRVE